VSGSLRLGTGPGRGALLVATLASGMAFLDGTGLSGVATAAGPFVGGWLIDVLSWRAIFFLNVPLAVVAVFAAIRWVPESRAPRVERFDVAGALLAAAGLAGVTYALIESADRGVSSWSVLLSVAVGAIASVAFVLVERHRGPAAMLPPSLFASRLFSSLNVYTVAVYAALSGLSFFLVVYLQNVAGFSALAAGASILPATVLMLVGSSWSGALATRIGPRPQLTAGPLVAAAGLLMLRQIGPDANFWTDVLPGTVVFGAGLTLLVAPLTTAVLGAVDDEHAGVASGVNNAAARAGGLLAVAALPLLVGLSGTAYEHPDELAAGYRGAMLWCAGLLAAGAVLGLVLVHRPEPGKIRPGERS
jgi:predicted MFS family arabinose efflux permease